jgi:lyso-ornithine lipid O-acyltransferase
MAAADGRVGPVGLARFGLRLIALAAWLIACLILHGLWRLVSERSPWPQRFLAGLCRIVGVQVSQTGSPARGSLVFLANHVSWIDIPALGGATGTAFVAHAGLADFTLMRWLCSFNDTVFVARHDRRSIHRQVGQVREALRDRGALALFPEGTTGDGVGLLPFKSSLLAAVTPPPSDTAIQPVVLDYAEAEAVAWVGDEPGPVNFRRILARKRPVRLTLHFLDPLPPMPDAHRKALAQAARDAILAEMSGWK